MPWTVVWLQAALDDLAECWLQASNKQLINEAADSIDAELRLEPDQKGEDFYGDRIIDIPPLAAVYLVRADERIVEIIQIQRSGPRV